MRDSDAVIEARYVGNTTDELKAMRHTLKMANRATRKASGDVSVEDRELLTEYTVAVRLRS